MSNFNQRPLDKISFDESSMRIILVALLLASSQAEAIEHPQKINIAPSSSSASTNDYFSAQSKSYSELLNRLNEIGSLDDNWNDFGASKFSTELINKTKKFLSLTSSISPSISVFPTADNSLQVEWEKENTYVEAEIFLDHIVIYAERFDTEVFNQNINDIDNAANEFLKLYKS